MRSIIVLVALIFYIIGCDHKQRVNNVENSNHSEVVSNTADYDVSGEEGGDDSSVGSGDFTEVDALQENVEDAGEIFSDDDVEAGDDESFKKAIFFETLDDILDLSFRDHGGNIAMAVYHPSFGLWKNSRGFKNHLEGVPIENDDHFRVASITKTFIAATVLKLYEDGVVDIDRTLDYWFPEFPGAGEITVRMLMNHTSAIKDYADAGFYTSILNNPQKKWEPSELVERAAKQGLLDYGPGGGCTYSNTNYIMLGIIISEQTGEIPSIALRNYFLNPLDLRDTFLDGEEELPYELVHGFSMGQDVAYWADPSVAWTAGAISSNSTDVAEWIYKLYRGDLLKEETMDEMFELQYDFMGLGVGKFSYDGGDGYGHGGGIPGYGSMALYFPDKDVSFVVLTAVDSENRNIPIDAVTAQVADLIFNFDSHFFSHLPEAL